MIYGIQRLDDLNRAMIVNADGPDEPLRESHRRTVAMNGNLEVLFDQLESRLVTEINAKPIVIGCMAWLTNEAVLRALAGREAVSVIVNKEDFLRPDKGNWSQQKIKNLYGELTGMSRYEADGVGKYSVCGDPTLDPIRCVGIAGPRSDVPPRMHHKFLVFCDWNYFRYEWPNPDCEVTREEYTRCEHRVDGWARYYRRIKPVAVWTGSFNATFNGGRSLENAVILRDADVALEFQKEWAALIGISEPLDWQSPYVAPEWRLGT